MTDRPVENCEGRDELWLRRFGKQEFGVSKTVEQLIQQQHPPPIFQDVELDWTIGHLPSLLEVEAVLREAPATTKLQALAESLVNF